MMAISTSDFSLKFLIFIRQLSVSGTVMTMLDKPHDPSGLVSCLCVARIKKVKKNSSTWIWNDIL